jgi:predicted DNA-binding transcriptional regulator YafY
VRRADRLIELIGHLKARPLVRAEDLAAQLEVSVRTVYRDIAAMQAQGLPIEGQAGVGFMLRGRVDLPAIAFGHDELEALALGLAYAEQVGDPELASAARAARGKVDLAWVTEPITAPSARPIRSSQRPERRSPGFGAVLRAALRSRRAVGFAYVNALGQRSSRSVRPLALIAFSEGWLLVSWCPLRSDFRTFRLDRIDNLTVGETFDDEPGRDLQAYLSRGSSRAAANTNDL